MKKFFKVRSIATAIVAILVATAFAGCNKSAEGNQESKESSLSTPSATVSEVTSVTEPSKVESSAESSVEEKSKEESKTESSVEEKSREESETESSVEEKSRDESETQSSVEEKSREESETESSIEENSDSVYIIVEVVHLENDVSDITRMAKTKQPIHYAFTDDPENFHTLEGIVPVVRYDESKAIVAVTGKGNAIAIDSELLIDLGPIG